MDFKITRFTVKHGQLYARTTAKARLSGPQDATRTRTRTATVRARIAQASNGRCSLISLSLAGLRLDLLGSLFCGLANTALPTGALPLTG